MSNRSATLVALAFTGLLAGANLAAAEDSAKPSGATKTANTCLSGPKGTAPAGGHWYYRLDRATKRQCWYVGDDKNKIARSAPQEAAAPATVAAAPAPPQPAPLAVSRSVADARAEWTSPPSTVARDTGVTAAASVPRTVTPDSAPPSAVGSRWADSSEMGASNHSRLAAADLAASSQATAASGGARETAAAPTVAPPISAAKNPSNSTQMLLIVMASALAFSVVVATLVFRFTGKPAAADELPEAQSPAPWDAEQLRRPAPPSFVQFLREDTPPPPRAEATTDDRAPGETERQIAAMLTRLARSATA